MAEEKKYSDKLQKVLKEISNKFSEEAIIDLSSDKRLVETLCSTGSMALDIILGGGYYKGRQIQILGPESSGKTTLALHAVAEVQKQGGVVGYIDAENAFDNWYAKSLGVNTGKLLFNQPNSGEEGLEIAHMLAESGEVSLIVIDSVPALMPQAQIDKEMGDTTVGLQSRLITQGITKLVPPCNKNGCTVIWINQLRDNISFFGGNESVPGGRALKFYSSVIIDVRRIARNEGDLGNGDKGFISNTIKVKTTKNKCFPPFRECELEIIYGKGLSAEAEFIDAGLKLSVLKKTGSGICFEEETPIYPKDTAFASSVPKAIDLFTEVEAEGITHPYYWVKREVELRTLLALGKVTEEELEAELAPIYEKQESNNEYSLKYLNLANEASSSSKLIEANYYITKAYTLNPFFKEIATKYKTLTKRYEDRQSTIKDWICTVQDLENNTEFEMDFSTGEIIEPKSESITQEDLIVDNKEEIATKELSEVDENNSSTETEE